MTLKKDKMQLQKRQQFLAEQKTSNGVFYPVIICYIDPKKIRLTVSCVTQYYFCATLPIYVTLFSPG